MRKCLSCPPDACGCPLTLLTLHPDLVLILFGFHATRLEALYFLFSLLPAVQTLHISPSAPSALPSPACLHTQLTTVPPHEHGVLHGTNISAKHPLHHSLKLALFCFLFFPLSFQSMFLLLNGEFPVPPTLCCPSSPASGFSSLRGSVDTLLEERAHRPAHQKSLLASSLLDEHITVMASLSPPVALCCTHVGCPHGMLTVLPCSPAPLSHPGMYVSG